MDYNLSVLLNELEVISPELMVIFGAFVALMLGAFLKKNKAEIVCIIAMTSVLCSMIPLYSLAHNIYVNSHPSIYTMGNNLIIDRFAIFSKFLILFSSFVILLLLRPSRSKISINNQFEISVLILLSTAGMMFLTSSCTLISLYMSMELMSIPLYILAASQKDCSLSSEAGMKYFILGALSSGLYLFGASLIYGFTGEVTWSAIYENIDNMVGPVLLFGMIFIIVAFCFKIAAAPFHMWSPDVYQGAPTIITAFFASAPKVASLAVICRLLFDSFNGAANQWQQIIIAISIASMLVGAFGAIMQHNFKRLIAYSSIGHVGFILSGVVTAEENGFIGMMLYVSIYITMSLGVFAIIMSMQSNKRSLQNFEDFKGLSKKHPYMSACMAVMMFSMAGIPPFAGFFAKMFILLPLIVNEFYIVALVFVATSVIAAYYYLRIIKVMYFDAPTKDVESNKSLQFILVITLLTLFNALFIFNPSPLINIAKATTVELFRADDDN